MSPDDAANVPPEWVVRDDQTGMRLDVFLTGYFPQYSRSLVRKAIQAAAATVEGQRAKAAYRLKAGQLVTFTPPPLPPTAPLPEDIPLTVLYEDESLAAIDKPAGMVVHPSKGHWSGTLAGALSHHFEQLSAAGGQVRPGIVHRLDRDTSGVLLVAKSDVIHHQLARQFAERTTEKQYAAIVVGVPDRDRDVIDRPIGKHPYHREKMAIRTDDDAREAQTFYEVAERFDGYALLRVLPKTGRTHQIRVHLASIGCAVLCDRLYGGRSEITLGELGRRSDDPTVVLARQALHAERIKITHPATGEPLEISAPLPEDIARVLEALRDRRRR
ncbi:MAG: RluA family pseudouridine synthase [Pirellulales bacterium]